VLNPAMSGCHDSNPAVSLVTNSCLSSSEELHTGAVKARICSRPFVPAQQFQKHLHASCLLLPGAVRTKGCWLGTVAPCALPLQQPCHVHCRSDNRNDLNTHAQAHTHTVTSHSAGTKRKPAIKLHMNLSKQTVHEPLKHPI
jgi:hypothetical protein